MKKLYRGAKLAFYKYREIFIVVFCLCVLIVFGLSLLEVCIEESPYLSLVGVFLCLTVFYAANKYTKSKKI